MGAREGLPAASGESASREASWGHCAGEGQVPALQVRSLTWAGLRPSPCASWGIRASRGGSSAAGAQH